MLAHALLRAEDLDELAELVGDDAPSHPNVPAQGERLYWSAMKMCRRPELMQLLSVKSMMRYGPPAINGGFRPLARQRVEPFARAAGKHHHESVVEHESSLLLPDDARWSTIGARDA